MDLLALNAREVENQRTDVDLEGVPGVLSIEQDGGQDSAW
jgi:hypothetical protein